MRLDGVEIKVNLQVKNGATAKDLDKLAETLGLRDPRHWFVWFYEEPATGEAALPLLEDRVVVRVRARLDEDGLDKGECTVKLRPCLQGQLTPAWEQATSSATLDYSIEQDWSGTVQVLAVSAKVDLDPECVTWLATVPRMAEGTIKGRQARFLRECAPRPVDVARLRRLGPIAAVRWEAAEAGGLAALGARAERWTVGDLHFLEVSAKVDDPLEAPGVQQALAAELVALKLKVDADQDSKTRRVLTALAELT